MNDARRATGLAACQGVLRLPGAAAFSAAGALARVPQKMVGLATVLLLVGLGRSYTLGGLVAGTLALAQGLASPWVSRLIGRIRRRALANLARAPLPAWCRRHGRRVRPDRCHGSSCLAPLHGHCIDRRRSGQRPALITGNTLVPSVLAGAAALAIATAGQRALTPKHRHTQQSPRVELDRQPE